MNQPISVKNIVRQAAKPSRFLVMAKKVLVRFNDTTGKIDFDENLKWIDDNATPFEDYAMEINEDLWEESKQIANVIHETAKQKLANIEYDLGGGGIYPLLYFITRYTKPNCIVETGVAAGFSSQAFLLALSRNRAGKLYSSDFPYFRLPNPEKYIGILVDEDLKNNWHLHIDGDEINLPKIMAAVEHVDIFHYDSDKSYVGRTKAIETVSPRLDENSLIIFDDIQDNAFFHDYVTKSETGNWTIFKFENKYIGFIGKPVNKFT